MADGIERIDYGWQPSGFLQGYLGEQENKYVRARRDQLAQEAQTAREQAAKDKEMYNKYLQAQIDRWKNEERDIGGYKAAQAEQLREQGAYAPLSAIAKMGSEAMAKGDMAGVQQAAERYNMLENNMPASVRNVLGKPQTYQDVKTGRTLESRYDPQLLSDVVENMARSKGIVGLQQQGMKGDQAMDVERERTARALAIQRMKSDVARAKAAAKAAGNTKLEGLITQLETAYLYEQDPAVQEEIKSKLQHAVVVASQLKPQPLEAVVEDDGIGRAPKNLPPEVPDLGKKPDPLGIR